MTKLSEYLKKEKSLNSQSEKENQTRIVKESFKAISFRDLFLDLVVHKINNELKLLSENTTEFEIREYKRKIDTPPYLLKFELNIYHDNTPAQYFLRFTADPDINIYGFYVELESSGYARSLDKKEILFEDVSDLDFEEYLVELLKEFKQFD